MSESGHADGLQTGSGKLFRSFLDSATDYIILLDGNLTMLDCNQAVLEVSGETRDTVIGRNLLEFFPDAITSGRDQKYRDVIKSGKPFNLDNLKIMHGDLEIYVTLKAFKVGDGMGLIATDITAGKQAADALLKEKEYFRSFVESLSDWAWELDTKGIHTYSNSAVKAILGYEIDEVVSQSLTKLWARDTDPAQSDRHLKFLLSSRSGWKNFVGKFKHKDGSHVYTESTAIPILDDNNQLVGFRGLDRDITKRKKVEETLRQSAEKIEKLHDSVLRFAGCGDFDEVYLETINSAEQLFQMSFSVLALSDGDRFEIKAISSGQSIQSLNFELLNSAIARKSLKVQRTILINERSVAEPGEAVQEPFRSMISTPIADVGIYQAFSTSDNAFSDTDIRILNLLIGHTVEAINRIKLQNNLERQATHDPLTGVYNRYYLSQFVQRELKRAQRSRNKIGFVMVDIDRFKEINDKFGHQMGDKILKAVAETLTKSVRETDIIVRYGGDEFLLILPETQSSQYQVVSRIESNIDIFNSGNDLLNFPLTLSIGSAYWDPEDDQSVEDIQNLADKRMYDVKKKKLS